jgi:hypothetical protein
VSNDILTCRCRHCGANFPYLRIDAGCAGECPECRKAITLPGNLQGIAAKRRGRINEMRNLIPEIGGLLLLFWYPIGSAVGVALIGYGWWKSRVWRCSNCEEIVKETDARCPFCKSAFASE